MNRKKPQIGGLLVVLTIFFLGCSPAGRSPVLDHQQLANEYFGEDAQWYLDNVPFFECSDKQIEQVYYYRWKLYKAHIRNTGTNQYVITEFINHVPWDREPYCTINAASMLHIYEGRWLKDNRYLDGYINNLYQEGGNNHHYSEGIADAAYARFLVNADTSFITSQLDSMRLSYNGWSDHWDSTRNLYWIPAMPDATEYTIASIDASGGKDGFAGGEAFRPTINSYMYGNALAIAKIAALKGDLATSEAYRQKAAALRENVLHSLWNDSLQHFTDRFKQDNQYVHNWDFIRGRELAGMVPWFYDLPTESQSTAWKHLADTTQLLGTFGLRTNEPSYEYYFKQYTYSFGQRGSQWNGPSWPYQSSQAITAMANLLNDYRQDVVRPSDYMKLLRLFARQHYLPEGKLDLVENYDPNLGGPIVYYYWSNHYNHSSFNNLVITGLCGIRPSEGDTLTINPLTDDSIRYFCLDDVLYHGHRLTVLYDKDGTRYNKGKGVTVFIDGKKASFMQEDGRYRVVVGPAVANRVSPLPQNFALNISRTGYPMPSASINTMPDTSLYQAVDGRVWYFMEITNRWTSLGSRATSDWYQVDFGQPRGIVSAKIYLVTDGKTYTLPEGVTIEYQKGDQWRPVKMKERPGDKLIGNTVNSFLFERVTTNRMRVNFKHGPKAVAVSEIEFYGE